MSSTRLFLAVAALMLVWQLMVPPVIGVGNNGDFSRTYGIFHMTMPVADEVRYADTYYRFDPGFRYFAGFYSSEILLVAPAVAINTVLSKDGRFDIRFQGLVHGILFISALWLFFPLLADAPRPLRWLTGGLAIAMFSDVMYVAYLNSFYSDVAAYLFLLLTVVATLRLLRWGRRTDLILLVTAGLFLVTSKAQHAALGFGIAALLFFVMKRRLAAVLIALTAILWLWKSTPEEYAARGCFSTIFGRILPHARDIDRTLADLRLDPGYRQYIGMLSFSANSPLDDPHFVAEFRRHITYGHLAIFLLTHPRDTYVALRVSLDEAARQRPAIGNFDRSAGLPPGAESQAFAYWSNAKRVMFEHRGSRYFTCFGLLCGGVAALLWWHRKTLPKGAVFAGLTLVAMAATELSVASLADAMDVPRHHLLFYAFFDLLLLTAVWLLGLAITRHYSPPFLPPPPPPPSLEGGTTPFNRI